MLAYFNIPQMSALFICLAPQQMCAFATIRGDKMCKVNPDDCKGGCCYKSGTLNVSQICLFSSPLNCNQVQFVGEQNNQSWQVQCATLPITVLQCYWLGPCGGNILHCSRLVMHCEIVHGWLLHKMFSAVQFLIQLLAVLKCSLHVCEINDFSSASFAVTICICGCWEKMTHDILGCKPIERCLLVIKNNYYNCGILTFKMKNALWQLLPFPRSPAILVLLYQKQTVTNEMILVYVYYSYS